MGEAPKATPPPSASRAYAAEQLGDVVFVELPEAGRKVKKGESRRRRGIGEGGERRLHARLRRGRWRRTTTWWTARRR